MAEGEDARLPTPMTMKTAVSNRAALISPFLEADRGRKRARRCQFPFDDRKRKSGQRPRRRTIHDLRAVFWIEDGEMTLTPEQPLVRLPIVHVTTGVSADRRIRHHAVRRPR